jgi:hypothetical protein
MSDYYDDSFESESDSDSGEKEEADHGEASNSVQNPSFTTRDIHLAPSLLTNPRLSAALRGSGSGSDLEEHEFSRFRPTSKSERSPKVSRMKFRVKKPNIGNFTQKIKNKLKRGKNGEEKERNCEFFCEAYSVIHYHKLTLVPVKVRFPHDIEQLHLWLHTWKICV